MKRTRKRLSVTNSETGTFRSCRLKWWLAYHQLLRPIRTARPLSVGSTIHAGVAEMYRAIARAQERGVTAKLDQLQSEANLALHAKLQQYLAELDELMVGGSNVDELVAEAEAMEAEAEGAVERFIDRFGLEDQERFVVLAVERVFSVRFPDAKGGHRLPYDKAGVWDLVLYDPELGDVVLGEHKSTSNDVSLAERKLDLDPQTTGYVWALGEEVRSGKLAVPGVEFENLRVGRVMYNVTKKKGPREPSLNKPDKITGVSPVSAAAVDTTVDVYEAALQRQEAQGLPRNAKQVARLESLRGPEKYVARVEAYHSPAMLSRWVAEEVETAREMRRLRRLADKCSGQAAPFEAYRNPEHCNPPGSYSCAYRTLCIDDGYEKRASLFRVAGDAHEEIAEARAEEKASSELDLGGF